MGPDNGRRSHGGLTVALTPEQQARAFSQALGYVQRERQRDLDRGAGRVGIGVSAITRDLYAANKDTPGANFSSYAAVVRRAVDAENLAYTMGENSQYAPTVADIPEVPTLYEHTERFRYRVVVTHSTLGGPQHNVIGEVRSDRRLNADEVIQAVNDRIDYGDSPVLARRKPMVRLSPDSQIHTIDIIAVTRIY